MMKLC